MARRRPTLRGASPTLVGLLVLVTIVGLTWAAFTRFNPLHDAFTLRAAFQTSGNLTSRSPVRIAGIDVGKVKAVEPVEGGGVVVELELEEDALPIHADTELKIRPRILFGGNFFVELQPGSPSAPVVDDGHTIPVGQTAAPVQLGDVLEALQADTRADLQTLVQEYGEALAEGGADGLRTAAPFLAPAYRDLALTNQAALGEEPDEDVRRVIAGTRHTVAALAEDEQALQELVTDVAATAGALGREDAALEASLPALRGALRTGVGALASLNAALPSVRTLAREALPGVRSAGPALDASGPFVRQARLLLGPRELARTARALRTRLPGLVALNETAVPLFEQGRAASACTARVLVPFVTADFPDPDFPANSGTVNQKVQRSFVGLAGESRIVDANQSYFHASVAPPPVRVRPAPPPDGGSQPPPRRPDVPCETQEPPNLEAPGAAVLAGGELAPLAAAARAPRPPAPGERRAALLDAGELYRTWQRRLRRTTR